MNNDLYRGFIKGYFSLLDTTIYNHCGFHIEDGMTFCNGSGVYIIIRIETENLKASIYYIGSSKDVRARLRGKHNVYDSALDEEDLIELTYTIRYISCDNYLDVEKRLIKVLQPSKNKNGKLWKAG